MKLFSLIIASLLFLSCTAQKNVKLYAYRQPVFAGGSPRGVIDESGKEVPAVTNERVNFFIFVESASANVQVKEIWIKQKPYAATIKNVQAPFIIKSDVNQNVHELVPKTSNKVWQVMQGLPLDISAGSKTRKLLAGKELLVHCVINGKDQYYSLASIKKLPPVALQ